MMAYYARANWGYSTSPNAYVPNDDFNKDPNRQPITDDEMAKYIADISEHCDCDGGRQPDSGFDGLDD